MNHSEYNLKRYYLKRQEYIAHMGGKCKKCGSVNNLHFDHIDPSTKSFTIGSKLTYPKDYVLAELEKCQLLCQKCHIVKSILGKDGYNKRAKGSSIGASKLTENVVKDIKNKLDSHTDKELAEIYKVGRKSINNIRHGVTWKHQ